MTSLNDCFFFGRDNQGSFHQKLNLKSSHTSTPKRARGMVIFFSRNRHIIYEFQSWRLNILFPMDFLEKRFRLYKKKM